MRNYRKTVLCICAVLTCILARGQKVAPLAYYTNKSGTQMSVSSVDDEQAPLTVAFRANPSDMDGWTPSYEWHFRLTRKSVNNGKPREVFVRWDENTEYTFLESGAYDIVLKTHLKQTSNPSNTLDLDSVAITVNIAESKLEFPNAFSPNGDGINDIYRAKPEYKSIVSFRAIILNRWGQKLYEWNDPAGGWDGKFHGHDVEQGVYFVLVEAKGADGVEYKIRKDVNLLRGYTDSSNNTTGGK